MIKKIALFSVLFVGLVFNSFGQFNSQKQKRFRDDRPDDKIVIGLSGGGFVCPAGSFMGVQAGMFWMYGGVFEFGYDFVQEPNGVYSAHIPRVTIFYPVTNEAFRIGVGYSPINTTTSDLAFEKTFKDKYGSVPANQSIWKSGWYHSVRLDAVIRLLDHVELRVSPVLGGMNGGSVALTYRIGC